MGEDVVHAEVDLLEVRPALVHLGLARHLARPPRLAGHAAADVMGRRAAHAEPAPVGTHLVDLAAQQVNDALGAREERHLAAVPHRGLEAVEQVVVLVVAIDEERRPRTAVQPVDEELLLECDGVVPHEAEVTADDDQVAFAQRRSLGPTVGRELADVKPTVDVTRNVNRHGSASFPHQSYRY